MKSKLRVLLGTLLLVCAQYSGGESFVPEKAFTEILPENNGQEWFWSYGSRVPSTGDGQAYLFDQEGKRLGQLSTGYWFNSLVNAKKREEIITVETYLSRGMRGERTDIVAIYDPRTLSFKQEIVIPPKRMNSVKNNGLLTLTEDERFALIANYTPAQSITIVDLDQRLFVEEIETPGCSVLYSAGNRDFYAICGNGAFMQIKLGDDGRVVTRKRTAPLFDPVNDFLTIAASQIGNTWYFVSRQYNVYGIRMDGDSIEVSEQWSLVTDDEREDDWTIAGMDHTAAHERSNRFYVLMHQGEAHKFEEPATHVWIYDVRSGKKVQEIELAEMANALKVSEGNEPRLYTLNFHFPMPTLFTAWIYLMDGESALKETLRQRMSVYDAISGEHQFYSELIPHGGFVMQVQPW